MKFNWGKYKHFGHKFTPIYRSTIDNGWHKCSICKVLVYTDTDSHFADKLMYWEDDLFHTNFGGGLGGVVEFNFTCNEVIIKKIIE